MQEHKLQKRDFRWIKNSYGTENMAVTVQMNSVKPALFCVDLCCGNNKVKALTAGDLYRGDVNFGQMYSHFRHTTYKKKVTSFIRFYGIVNFLLCNLSYGNLLNPATVNFIINFRSN